MTHRKNGWTDSELQHIYDHINEKGAVNALALLLPNRTRAAIIAKLHLIREEAGILVGGRPSYHRPGIEREAMAYSSAALASAIEDILSLGGNEPQLFHRPAHGFSRRRACAKG